MFAGNEAVQPTSWEQISSPVDELEEGDGDGHSSPKSQNTQIPAAGRKTLTKGGMEKHCDGMTVHRFRTMASVHQSGVWHSPSALSLDMKTAHRKAR
jgi:hypothetical protein